MAPSIKVPIKDTDGRIVFSKKNPNKSPNAAKIFKPSNYVDHCFTKTINSKFLNHISCISTPVYSKSVETEEPYI